MTKTEFNRMIDADIQRLMSPKLRPFVVTVVSKLNHYDDVTVMASCEDTAIDKILDTRSYDIRALYCNETEVHL